MRGVGVHLVGLAHGTASDESADKGSHSWPPVILLKERDGAEVSAVGACQELMDAFDKGVLGGFGDVEVEFVIEGAMVEIPIAWQRVGERNGVHLHGSQSVDDELVGGWNQQF